MAARPHASSLGEFIRAHRDRVTPEQVGLPGGFRRRAKGLRREELAALADISPTWLTWIEQGRAPSVSAAVLARIADALVLTRAERDYLFRLAAQHDPSAAQPRAPDDAADLLAAALRAVRGPAYVLDHAWDAVAWNAPAARLFIGWLDRGATDRNLLRFMFTSPMARRLVHDWPERAARLVAEFRADSGASLELPMTRRAVQLLRLQSPEFDALWRKQGVLEREGGERRFNHPTLGRVVHRQLTLRVAAAAQLKLVMLV